MGNTNTTDENDDPVVLKIRFKSASLKDFIRKHAIDVSQGGIFIRTKSPLEVGTPLKFEFLLREEEPLIDGEATVVWTRDEASKEDADPGMGLRFDRLPGASKNVLEKILREKNLLDSDEASDLDSNDSPTMMGSLNVKDLMAQSEAAEEEEEEEEEEDFNDDAFSEATVVCSLDDLAQSTKVSVVGTSPGAKFLTPTDNEEPEIEITSGSTARPKQRTGKPNVVATTKNTVVAKASKQDDIAPAPQSPSPPEERRARTTTGNTAEQDSATAKFEQADVLAALRGPNAGEMAESITENTSNEKQPAMPAQNATAGEERPVETQEAFAEYDDADTITPEDGLEAEIEDLENQTLAITAEEVLFDEPEEKKSHVAAPAVPTSISLGRKKARRSSAQPIQADPVTDTAPSMSADLESEPHVAEEAEVEQEVVKQATPLAVEPETNDKSGSNGLWIGLALGVLCLGGIGAWVMSKDDKGLTPPKETVSEKAAVSDVAPKKPIEEKTVPSVEKTPVPTQVLPEPVAAPAVVPPSSKETPAPAIEKTEEAVGTVQADLSAKDEEVAPAIEAEKATPPAKVLSLESTPPGAVVFINGRKVGKSPVVVPLSDIPNVQKRVIVWFRLKGHTPIQLRPETFEGFKLTGDREVKTVRGELTPLPVARQ